VRVGNEINRVRGVFKYGTTNDLIKGRVVFGDGFKRPSRKTLRHHRHAKGPRMFTAEEIRRLIDAAGQPLKAMLLLGINCGYGNADVGHLPLSAIDLDAGWVDYPRPKTGIQRRCPLWPETVQAIREALTTRPKPKAKADAELIFVTAQGHRWAKEVPDSPVAKETAKLMHRLGMSGRKGRGFYTLRHVHETIGGEAKDQVAVDAIMGHARDDMASVYREGISDGRLRAVTNHVRAWLFTV
jgi:integrase